MLHIGPAAAVWLLPPYYEGWFGLLVREFYRAIARAATASAGTRPNFICPLCVAALTFS